MINITTLINQIPNFNHLKYAKFNRAEALRSAGYHTIKDKWFNKLGELVGDNKIEACESENIYHETYLPTKYFALSDDHPGGEDVYSIHGVKVRVYTDAK